MFSNRFVKQLMVFICGIIVMLTMPSVLMLVGWELIGVLSLLLIGFWVGRSDVLVAGYYAVIYNRVREIYFMLLLLGLGNLTLLMFAVLGKSAQVIQG